MGFIINMVEVGSMYKLKDLLENNEVDWSQLDHKLSVASSSETDHNRLHNSVSSIK